MLACDREGVFRAELLDYGLKEMESGSVAVSVHCKLTEIWDDQNKAWADWREYDMEAFGDVWIVKKDGTTNDKAAESLMRYAGWSGSLVAVSDGSWKPTPFQVTISKEVYKDQASFKIAFVNDYDRTPGGVMSNVTPDKVKALEARFGAPLRALSANVGRNKPRSQGNPLPMPPPPPPAPAGAGSNKADGIPF